MIDGITDRRRGNQSLQEAAAMRALAASCSWAKANFEVRSTAAKRWSLYCGLGRYEDNQKSTPLLVLEKAIASPELRKRLITLFNDEKEEYSSPHAGTVTSSAPRPRM